MRAAVAVATTILLAACLAPARAPAGAAPARLGEATCAGCHPAVAEEWAPSMHHASFTSPDFQHSFRVEPRAYCVGCHAPIVDQTSGIGCTACHEAAPEHARLAERARATTKPCVGCHDFDLPGSRAAMLQATEREHRESAFAARTCEDCHMPPEAGSRRDHRIDVTRNRDLLARAIRVQYARIEGNEIVVGLASAGVGHRFPTGDLFRQLTVVLTGLDAAGNLVAGETFHLHRDWDRHRASIAARTPEPLDDDRLSAAPQDLRARFDRAPARVHLTVTYERGRSARADALESFATLDLVDTDLALTR